MFGLIGSLIGWIAYHLGLRTDVASSTGSLHAKVKDIADTKIGTSADVRATNSVMGWLKTQVKSRQLVTFTPNATSYAVAITSVDVTKSLFIVNGNGITRVSVFEVGNFAYPNNYYISAASATSVTIACPFTSGTLEYAPGSLQVIEFY